MAVTYEAIATQTLGSAAATVTFSSIASTWTDLILVINATTTSGNRGLRAVLNSDSGSNYSSTYISGDGTSASSGRYTSTTYLDTVASLSNATPSTTIMHFQNYSNASTYKTILTRNSNSAVVSRASIGLWRNTSAITSILVQLSADNLNTGSTFTLYGIKAA